MISYSLLGLYPGGIPTTELPSCEAPRQPTIYALIMCVYKKPVKITQAVTQEEIMKVKI